MSEKKEQSNETQAEWKSPLPGIIFPKGGGAIRGLGEKASVNPATGTSSIQIPIAITSSRANVMPSLSLSYDSGQGNGIFGLGWNIMIPSISRKTDKGLPRYFDAEESDTFLISGAEDLVPISDAVVQGEYLVKLYCPRIEGSFARIERWEHQTTGELHWRSISKENVTNIYGRSAACRIADSHNSLRVYQWLLEESFDDKGNIMIFQYKQENEENVAPVWQGRSTSNRYIKQIYYGNRYPFQKSDWLFRVVFDYGEHDQERPMIEEKGLWDCRQDAFSQYRAGFEQRTYRLCRRILLFHQMEELGTEPCLVRLFDLRYVEDKITSYLVSFTQTGCRRKADGSYVKSSLPPLEFSYTPVELDPTVYRLDTKDQIQMEGQWVDLDSEGLSGILTQQADGWYYQRNLGGGRFGRLEAVGKQPSLMGIKQAKQQFMDLAGDGKVYWVQFSNELAGYYERTAEGEWKPFTPFPSQPQIDWNDPNLRFIDLSGDGQADLLITRDDLFLCSYSLATEGFSPAEVIPGWHDEEKGPALVFADATESIYLSDMSGDGLADLVRIRNGEVCYWPNLGYGRFGSKVMMENAPLFDHPDLFEQRSIRLADVDGSGVTDLIYLGRKGTQIWLNQSGNSWSEPMQLPAIDHSVQVEVLDLLGTGTPCILWTSSSIEEIMYLNPLRGKKPHLLTSFHNNRGSQTQIQYVSSTYFYLQDRANGKPWVTHLPFPVYVVKQMEVYDRISHNRSVSSYAYHHGYYDGIEREFRGFGMVEQWDTEEKFATGKWITYTPPVLTKSWFHTGAYLEQISLSQAFQREYFRELGLNDQQFSAQLLPDTVLPVGLTALETREAYRSLKGSLLRKEIFASDGSAKSAYPYLVEEQNYTMKLLHPIENKKHAVFYVHAREGLIYHYERNPTDPRIQHQLTLEVDSYGNILTSAQVVYGRRMSDLTLTLEEQAKQHQMWITVTENDYTNAIQTSDAYRVPLIYKSSNFELTGIVPTDRVRFCFEELTDAIQIAEVIAYEVIPSTGLVQKRQIEEVRTLYWKNDLSGALPLGQLESLAVLYESYKLAFSTGLLNNSYEDRVYEELLIQEGGYVYLADEGKWLVPAGRTVFAPDAAEHFYQPTGFTDPFGNTSWIEYDQYDLHLTKTIDPYANVVEAEIDYRVLQPKRVIEPNGNRSDVVFDALGMVVGTAVMGKSGESLGDSLGGFEPDLDEETLLSYLENPIQAPQMVLQQASSRLIYDMFRYQRTSHLEQPQPNLVYSVTRETHNADLPTGEQSVYQHKVVYSDGFEREIQTKVLTDSGEVAGTWCDVRWIGSGWTVFNNKGNPVKKYEPFFSTTHQFTVNPIGVSSTLFYDPIGRVVAKLHPNHTYEKTVFDTWRQETWDVNDTIHPTYLFDPRTGQLPDPLVNPIHDPDVGVYFQALPQEDYLPTWYQPRINGTNGIAEQKAAEQAAKHAATPSVTYMDSLGRAFLSLVDNGLDQTGVRQIYRSYTEYDIKGNQRIMMDAQERIVMDTDYNLLGYSIKQMSMEAGTRWMLQDVMGKPIRRWDQRNVCIRHTYDRLHRPIGKYVRQGAGPERLVECITYGEKHPEASIRNLRTKPFMHFDGAGVIEQSYDFKGNPVRAIRQFTKQYKQVPDWSILEPLIHNETGTFDLSMIETAIHQVLELDTFITTTHYDALNRIKEMITPDQSKIRPHYNQTNQLKQVTYLLPNTTSDIGIVKTITYDAKGQRQQILYGNEIKTLYSYDPQTFRLVQLLTLRADTSLQNLEYTYDPIGNIIAIQDNAQQTTYFHNQVISPQNEYFYDALYRLLSASGREQIGLGGVPQTTYNDVGRTQLAHPMDGQAIRSYKEQYEYDEVGNLLRLVHHAVNGNWLRSYAYGESSLIQPSKKNNRLSSTRVGSLTDSYQYDVHGNITQMPHLSLLSWDEQDRLQGVDLGGGGTAYYQYDAQGQRVRKVMERQTGTRMKERLYLGPFETYREYGGDGTTITLERQTLHVMDNQKRVAMVDRRTKGNDSSPVQLLRYQLSTHLDSATLELDEVGQIISYEEYYPYGGTAYQSVRTDIEVPLKRYRFTGKERDEETGFYYYGARFYAPWLGRWMSCDPAGFVDGYNLYSYVRGNPIVFHDPNGMARTKPDARIGDVKQYNNQGKSLYNAAGKRISEHEHTMPGAQLKTLTNNTATGVSDYTDSNYRKNTTVTVEDGLAYDKTHVGPNSDNMRTERLKQVVRDGGGINYKEDIFHASLDKMKTARDAASSAVTDSQIHQALLSQDGEMFDLQDLHESASKIGASADDVNRAIDTLDDAFGESKSFLGSAKELGGKALGFTGDALSVAGAGVSGWKVGSGIDQIAQGDKRLGTVDVLEGGTGLAIDIGVPALAAKGGAAVVGGSATALGITMGIAGASVGLAAETARAGIKGEKTPIDVADEFYGTHFGDIYGWATGAYRGR